MRFFEMPARQGGGETFATIAFMHKNGSYTLRYLSRKEAMELRDALNHWLPEKPG